MNPNLFLKQMIDFNRTGFESGFSFVTMFQEQAEKAASTCLDQAPWMPSEGRAIAEEWIKACRHGRESFKNSVNENFQKFETFLPIAKKAYDHVVVSSFSGVLDANRLAKQ